MARWFVDRLPQRGIPSVSLRRLLPEARFVGCHDWEVSGCTADSRRLDPGQVFVAVRGRGTTGTRSSRRRWSGARRGWWSSGPAPRRGGSRCSSPTRGRRWRGSATPWRATRPSSSLTIGVTGTCGKTVTSLFLRSIFEATGARFGLVGSLGWSDGVTTRPVGRAVARRRGAGRDARRDGRARLPRRGDRGLRARPSGGGGSRAWRSTRRSSPTWRAVRRRATPEPLRASVDGSRPGCSARSSPAARRWSTPTTRTPSSSARSTSTRAGSRSRSSGPPT